MARGWESKSVEAQQESLEADRTTQPAPSAAEIKRHQDRARLALALARAQADLDAATVPAHRRMLQNAVSALQQQLDGVSTSDAD